MGSKITEKHKKINIPNFANQEYEQSKPAKKKTTNASENGNFAEITSREE